MPDISINAVRTDWYRLGSHRHVISTAPLTAYVFYKDSSNDLNYRKTTDGGLTFEPEIQINGSTARFDVWYDQFTPGDEGDLIHIAFHEFAGANEIFYNSLNVTDDSLSGDVLVVAAATNNNGNWNQGNIGITKAVWGNLYIQYWGDPLGSHGFHRSIDSGVSWTIRTDGADGNEVDSILVFPGNESDTQDIWMAYWDRSANEFQLRIHDDSANSWSSTLIAASMFDSIIYHQSAGMIRHSDNHLILAAWNDLDSATADLKVFDIASPVSIVELTDVLENTQEAMSAGITINQQNDDIYVTYIRGTTFTSVVGTHYKLSEDGGAVWSAERPMSENAEDDLRIITSPISINNDGGIFLPVWMNDDLSQIFCNADNAVSIPVFVPPPPPSEPPPEYGQRRAAIGDPSVYGATIVRS